MPRAGLPAAGVFPGFPPRTDRVSGLSAALFGMSVQAAEPLPVMVPNPVHQSLPKNRYVLCAKQGYPTLKSFVPCNLSDSLINFGFRLY